MVISSRRQVVGRTEVLGSLAAEVASTLGEFLGHIDADDEREVVAAAVIAEDIATDPAVVTSADLGERPQTVVALRTGVVRHPVPKHTVPNSH